MRSVTSDIIKIYGNIFGWISAYPVIGIILFKKGNRNKCQVFPARRYYLGAGPIFKTPAGSAFQMERLYLLLYAGR